MTPGIILKHLLHIFNDALRCLTFSLLSRRTPAGQPWGTASVSPSYPLILEPEKRVTVSKYTLFHIHCGYFFSNSRSFRDVHWTNTGTLWGDWVQGTQRAEVASDRQESCSRGLIRRRGDLILAPQGLGRQRAGPGLAWRHRCENASHNENKTKQN